MADEPIPRGHLLHPPLRDRRFWVVQAMLVGIFLLHEAGDGRLGLPHPPGGFELFPIVALFVPVIYAALNYGFGAAAATTASATVLTIVDLVLDARKYSSGDVALFFLQMIIFDGVAVLVARRISAEQRATARARRAAAAAEQARNRYRALFDDSAAPILILDGEGRISESNSTARVVFGEVATAGRNVGALVGGGFVARLRDQPGGEVVTITTPQHGPLLFQVTHTRSVDMAGRHIVELVFHDVTAERLRHRQAAAFARAMVRGQEEERRYLAQEIHDQPLQTLVHLVRLLDATLSDDDLTEETRQAVEEAQRTATTTIEGLRDIVRGLRPPALDDIGVVACLRRLVADVGERSGLESQFVGPAEDIRLPSEAEVAVFRIAQEALSNVERHAAAGKVSVRLEVDDGRVGVTVSDDGIGFDTPDPADPSASTLGIVGMRERAAALGGRVDIRSTVGAGTVVAATVPLSPVESVP